MTSAPRVTAETMTKSGSADRTNVGVRHTRQDGVDTRDTSTEPKLCTSMLATKSSWWLLSIRSGAYAFADNSAQTANRCSTGNWVVSSWAVITAATDSL
jgi:hypothetical protein